MCKIKSGGARDECKRLFIGTKKTGQATSLLLSNLSRNSRQA